MYIPHRLFIRKILLLLFLAGIGLVFLAACASGTRNTGESSQKIQFSACQLSVPGLKTSLKAECGKLNVFEDQVNQSGRQIELNLAVIPAVSRSPASDPIFFLAGGPGEAATQAYPLISSAFQ